MNWNNMEVTLRFLPQPLYRYEVPDKDSSYVDGAVSHSRITRLMTPKSCSSSKLSVREMKSSGITHPLRLTNREARITKLRGKKSGEPPPTCRACSTA